MRVVRPVFHWSSLVHGRSFIRAVLHESGEASLSLGQSCTWKSFMRAVLHESGEASLSLGQSCTWKIFYEGSFTLEW